MFTQELVPQYLTGLATSSHGIDVDIGKGLFADVIWFVAVCKYSLIILEYELEEVVLDVLSPEWLSVILL